MFLIPIVYRRLGDLHQCWLLLERNGMHAMEGNAEAAATFAAENGLEQRSELIVVPALNTTLLDIAVSPALAEFYTWAEVAGGGQPMREVWRPFLWSPAIAKGLEEISIGEGLTVAAVLEAYFKSQRVDTIVK
jgi:hypothetical protein